VGHLKRLARSLAYDPREGAREAWEDLRRRSERPAPALEAVHSPEWERELHAWLGAPWPCPQLEELQAVWQDAQERLREHGLRAGRGAYGGWDDGDQALARAVWCMAAHLRPQRVLETGVARGLTSRAVLERLARDSEGRLWSIDLPALSHEGWAGELGAAVPDELRERWTLVEGSSRQRLPGVVRELGSLDLFIHDSLHSERNMRFELERVWPAVRPGGGVIVDDVHMNAGFHSWVAAARDARSMVCAADDELALFAVAIKQGAAGEQGAAR
jgi:predicted O-methyltransferase YrrM